MEKIKCPRCGGNKIWKAGKPSGKQQHQCKECRRKFITELNYSEEFKRQAIQMFYEGNSGRAVGRLMKINKSTVYNWTKSLDKKIKNSKLDEENKVSKEIIEMDELYSYTAHKKQNLSNNICNKRTQTNCRF